MLSREWHNRIQILNGSYWLQIGRGQVEKQVTSKQLQWPSKGDLDLSGGGGERWAIGGIFFNFLVLISNVVIILLLFLKCVFIYLAVPGLGCRTQDL